MALGDDEATVIKGARPWQDHVSCRKQMLEKFLQLQRLQDDHT